MDRRDDGVRRSRQETVDEVRAGDRLRLRAADSDQMPARQNSGRLSSSANQTTSFFLVSGFVSVAYSAKLFAGTDCILSRSATKYTLDRGKSLAQIGRDG